MSALTQHAFHLTADNDTMCTQLGEELHVSAMYWLAGKLTRHAQCACIRHTGVTLQTLTAMHAASTVPPNLTTPHSHSPLPQT